MIKRHDDHDRAAQKVNRFYPRFPMNFAREPKYPGSPGRFGGDKRMIHAVQFSICGKGPSNTKIAGPFLPPTMLLICEVGLYSHDFRQHLQFG